MASLMEDLIQILSEEQELYEQMIPVEEEKPAVIIRNDLERLSEITNQEQEYADRISALEHRRRTNIADIATVMGKRKEELNISKIAAMLESQPKEQEKLCRLHDSLGKMLTRLKEQNLQNQVLIEQSLEMIQFNTNILQSNRVAPVNNYTSRASTMDIPISQNGAFDAKQ